MCLVEVPVCCHRLPRMKLAPPSNSYVPLYLVSQHHRSWSYTPLNLIYSMSSVQNHKCCLHGIQLGYLVFYSATFCRFQRQALRATSPCTSSCPSLCFLAVLLVITILATSSQALTILRWPFHQSLSLRGSNTPIPSHFSS